MARRIVLALVAVAGLVLGVPAAPADAATDTTSAAVTSCSVSTTGTQSCVYLGLTGIGSLRLTVSSGFAFANVGCVPIGSAFLGGEAPYSQTVRFERIGVCILQIGGTGSATATAS